jgi:hypothetical protein
MEVKQVRVRFNTEFYVEGTSRTESDEMHTNHTYEADDVVWINERTATVVVTAGYGEIVED